MVESHSSNFRVITRSSLGARIFRKFTVLVKISWTLDKNEQSHWYFTSPVQIWAIQFVGNAKLFVYNKFVLLEHWSIPTDFNKSPNGQRLLAWVHRWCCSGHYKSFHFLSTLYETYKQTDQALKSHRCPKFGQSGFKLHKSFLPRPYLTFCACWSSSTIKGK